MRYYGEKGYAWKTRNTPATGARKLKPRKLAVKPQWTVDDLWVTPFSEERRYETDGTNLTTSYHPIEGRDRGPTGMAIFDAWLRALSAGQSDTASFCRGYGLRTGDLDSVCFMLTGLRGVEFRLRYIVKTVDALLRYTDLPPAEVARRSGAGSVNNLFLTCRREYDQAPMERRYAIQKRGDLGRYRL